MEQKIVVVDLFCGAGGLPYGLQRAGLEIRAGYDLDPDCRFPYETNVEAQFIQQDICNVTKSELSKHYRPGEIRMLAGCAPCQPFSSYSQTEKARHSNQASGRWNLLKQFQRLVGEVVPDIVTLENVPGLARQDIWAEFRNYLEARDYQVSWEIIRCEKIGVPQKRRRLVLIASRIGVIELKPQTHPQHSVKDAIGSLPRIDAGEFYPSDPLHTAPNLTSINRKRMQASKPGGTWLDWPEELRLACHKKSTGNSYRCVYGRMRWDEAAPTMTTLCYGYGNGRFGHPDQERAITLREAALLQSFPKEYVFWPSNTRPSFSRIGKLIGNAVPPKLGEFIGNCITQRQLPFIFKRDPQRTYQGSSNSSG